MRPYLVHQNYNEEWLYSFLTEFTFCAFAINFLLTRCPLYFTIPKTFSNGYSFLSWNWERKTFKHEVTNSTFWVLKYKIFRIPIIFMLKALQWYVYDLDTSLSRFFVIAWLYIYRRNYDFSCGSITFLDLRLNQIETWWHWHLKIHSIMWRRKSKWTTQPIINALNLCYIHSGILLCCQLLLCICFCYYTKFSDLKAHIYFFFLNNLIYCKILYCILNMSTESK